MLASVFRLTLRAFQVLSAIHEHKFSPGRCSDFVNFSIVPHLEQRQLIARSGRRLRLTMAGQAFFRVANMLMERHPVKPTMSNVVSMPSNLHKLQRKTLSC